MGTGASNTPSAATLLDTLRGGGPGLVRVVVVGAVAYAILVGLLRLSGKRTLSRMSAADLVVSVALGNVLAMAMLSKGVSLLESLAAFAVLVALAVGADWLSSRFMRANRTLEASAVVLFYRGRFMRRTMRRERVTEDEVRAGIRQSGIASLRDVEAVVLESFGSLSVIRRDAAGDGSALEGARPGEE